MAADVHGERQSADDEAGMMGQSAIPAPAGQQTQEAEFAGALAARDPDAWRQLFDEHYDRIYRYAWTRTGNASDAEDVAASVFAEAVRGISKFEYRGTPVVAWLFRIAHNESADLLKRRARVNASALSDREAESSARVDELAVRAEWQDVADAVGALKEDQRNVLQLRLVEGRPVKEVAAMLNKSEAAVKVTQMRALQALRKRLEP
jgi:RNA polymerase sigma-70 factor (ECF subfamily)